MESAQTPLIEPWLANILANPVNKQPVLANDFPVVNGTIDSRVFLKNTSSYVKWANCQDKYIDLILQDKYSKMDYANEIEYDRPIYNHFKMEGRILDVGGGAGSVREFLPHDVEFVSIDPYLNVRNENSLERLSAYSCLNQPFNFIAATAEFLPFVSDSFDWVHMRSILDHVQLPDLALLEACRVVKPTGRVLIGLYVEGGKSGHIPLKKIIINAVTCRAQWVGINRWKDDKD